MEEAAKTEAATEERRITHHYDTRRNLPLRRRAQIPIISAAVQAAVRMIGPTLRFDTPGYNQLDRVHAGGRRFILAFWHRGMISMAWLLRHRHIVVLVSTNFDGQWGRRAMEGLGIVTAPGSSSRGGLRGLAVMAQKMALGHDTGFAIDGPHGPRYVAKVGPVLLARRTGCPIICFHAAPERARTLEGSWDLFQIPYPFSRVAVVFSAPIEVPQHSKRPVIESKHAEMQKMLERVRDAADGWYGLSPKERERERALWDGAAGRALT